MSCSLAHPGLALHPSLMPLLLSIKAWDTIIPTLHSSLSPSANKTATQLPLSSLFCALYQSLSLFSLSTSHGSRRSQHRELLLKYLLICFPQFYLFPSPPTCPPFSSMPTPETPSALRDVRGDQKKKIHNIKPLFTVCCTQ